MGKLTKKEMIEELKKMKEIWENAGGTWAGVVSKKNPNQVKKAFKEICKQAEENNG